VYLFTRGGDSDLKCAASTHAKKRTGFRSGILCHFEVKAPEKGDRPRFSCSLRCTRILSGWSWRGEERKNGGMPTILGVDFSYPILYIGIMRIKMANLKGQPWIIGIGGKDESLLVFLLVSSVVFTAVKLYASNLLKV
jgi:hypothetical protein